MEGEGGVIRTIIDELHSSYIQRDQMEGGPWISQEGKSSIILEIT